MFFMKNYYFFLFIVFILFSFISKEKITKVQYDFIIGYNYNVEDSILPKRPYLEDWNIIRNGEIQSIYIQNEKKLNQEQAKQVLKTIQAKTTYSNDASACLFNPRLTYVLYKDNIIVGKIDVCFECFQLESDLEIPAKENIEKKWTQVGLSKFGIENLKIINDQIGLYSYSE